MVLIVGLGNPGPKYEDTPHNAGFAFVDAFRDFLGWNAIFDVSDWEHDKYLEGEISIVKSDQNTKCVLFKPFTFMNESGRAVKQVINKYKIKPVKELILVHDDLDIKLGNFKIQRGKSPKRHNGILSVEGHLGDSDFLRVRLGVDNRNPEYRIPGETYVLNKLKNDDKDLFKEEIVDAVKSLRETISI